MPPLNAFSNPVEAFRTHANYIRAFGRIAADGIHGRRAAFESISSRFALSCPTVGGSPSDEGGVKRSLRNAWSTELLLDVTASLAPDDEFIRLANNWVVVQAYYTVYHATQALMQAKGSPRPTSHPPTQRQFLSLWSSLSVPLLPWGLAYSALGCKQFPPHPPVDPDLHAWAPCDSTTAWSLVAKALRTTRKYAVDEALSKRREDKFRERKKHWREAETERLKNGRRPRAEPDFKRPTLDAAEKSRVLNGVRPHSLIDYLWRLRIRTNYEDSAMFTEGQEDTRSSLEVRDLVRWIASSTLFVNELAVANIFGGRWFSMVVEEWLRERAPGIAAQSLRERQEFLTAVPG